MAVLHADMPGDMAAIATLTQHLHALSRDGKRITEDEARGLRGQLRAAWGEVIHRANRAPERTSDASPFRAVSFSDLSAEAALGAALTAAASSIPEPSSFRVVYDAYHVAFDAQRLSAHAFTSAAEVDALVDRMHRVAAAAAVASSAASVDARANYDALRAARLLFSAAYAIAACLTVSACCSNNELRHRLQDLSDSLSLWQSLRVLAAGNLLDLPREHMRRELPHVDDTFVGSLGADTRHPVSLQGVPQLLLGDAAVARVWAADPSMWDGARLKQKNHEVAVGTVCSHLGNSARLANHVYSNHGASGLIESLMDRGFRVRNVELPGYGDGVLVAARRVPAPSATARMEVLVLFRGSNMSPCDWLTNAQVWRRGAAFRDTRKGSDRPDLVLRGLHAGFSRRAEAVAPLVFEAINALLEDETEAVLQRPDMDVTVCGHSQGAALATLIALAIEHVYRPTIAVKLRTFASPGVLESAAPFDASAVRHINTVIDSDIVPRLGTRLGFALTGTTNVLQCPPPQAARWLDSHSAETYCHLIRDFADTPDTRTALLLTKTAFVDVAQWEKRVQDMPTRTHLLGGAALATAVMVGGAAYSLKRAPPRARYVLAAAAAVSALLVRCACWQQGSVTPPSPV